MKTKILILIITLLIAFSATAQETLTFRFSNPKIVKGAIDKFQFDIEVKANKTGTYHNDMQVYFDYNRAAFGENINENGKVSITKLALMNEKISNIPKYFIVTSADNTTSRFALFTESNFIGFNTGNSALTEISAEFKGFLQIQIDIADNSQTAGIKFNEDLMNGGEYYQFEGFLFAYTDPNLYYNDLLNEPLYLSHSIEYAGNNDEINIYSNRNIIYVDVTNNITGKITVYNIMGQEIAKKNFENASLNKIYINDSKAYFIVKVITDKNMNTRKVFVK